MSNFFHYKSILNGYHAESSLTPDNGLNAMEKRGGSSNIEQRLSKLGMATLGIAHELNGPLATIKACSEGLLKRMGKGKFDASLFKNYLEIIDEEVIRCNFITGNILRFIQEAEETEKQRIDIHESLDKTIKAVKLQGRCHHIEIVRKYQKTIPAIFGSECGLRQVFSAIIVNAIEAMTEEGILTLQTWIDGNMVCIGINNTGSPIPKDRLNTIFEPYYTTKAGQGGTGLGLFLASNIVKNNGGNIKVSSGSLEGTTFTIILPSRSHS